MSRELALTALAETFGHVTAPRAVAGIEGPAGSLGFMTTASPATRAAKQ
ncbi:hypothetical protein ACFTT0_06740 [Streptomyces bauhiniae]